MGQLAEETVAAAERKRSNCQDLCSEFAALQQKRKTPYHFAAPCVKQA
jgi:hypothetical protein